MSKFFKTLLLATFMLPAVLFAQTHYNLIIGTGTSTNSYVPSYGLYEHSYSQSLYTAAEVGLDGTIDTLSFYVDHNSMTRTLTVYMAEVSQTNLSSAVPASAFQQVYTGSVSLSTGWVALPLATPFSYGDTGSLVIAVIDGTGSWASGYPVYQGTQMSETRSRYSYRDGTAYTLSDATSNTSNFLPNIRLGISSYSIYCAAPSNVAVSGISGDHATITWQENGSATAWEVIVSDSVITNLSSASGVTVTNTAYTVYGLNGNTPYYVYVRALCDSSASSAWTNATTFRSACVGSTSTPYSTGFEDLATGQLPNCWVQVAQGSSSAGTFPSAYAYASNARASNVYFEFESSNGQTEIAALPEMDNLNTLQLSFYVSIMNHNFTFEVGVMEDTTFVPIDTLTFTVGSGNNWSGSYHPYTVYFDSYTGTGTRMAMRVTSSGSYTIMMDDLSVSPIPTCPPLSSLSVSNVTTTTADLSWSTSTNATSFFIEYDTVNFVPGTSSATTVVAYATPYQLTGLDSGYTYYVYVRGDCGGDTTPYLSTTFTTLATSPATLPFICNFEADGVNGWDLLNGSQTNQWCVGSAVNNGGSRSLYISNDGGVNNNYNNGSTSYVYAIRTLALSEAGEYICSYDWRNQGESNYYDYIRVFLAPASTDFNAGAVLGSSTYSFATYTLPAGWIELSGRTSSPWTLAQSSSWQTVTRTFTLLSPNTYKLVFAWANDASGGSNPAAAIDNVQLIRNTCPAPYQLTVTDVNTTDATITWRSMGTETSWEVSDGTYTYIASDTTYTITGLTPDSPYTFTVRAICDVDDTSLSVSVSTRTLQSCVRPLSIVVDSVLGDTVWVSWSDTTSATTFDLVYGPAGFNPDTVEVNLIAGVTDSSYMFTGLTMGQRYHFYVRIDCGSEQSSWVGPASAVPSYSYVMNASGVDTLRACGYTIYDNGGPDGNYSTSCNSTLVLYPSDPTYTFQLSGSGYVESSYDHLYIYDGVGTNGTLLFHGQGNFTMPPTNSEEGVVTIVFTSDASVNYSGYEISAACIPLSDCVRPGGVMANYIGTTTADITWTERGTATSWILEYDTVNFTPGTGSSATSMVVYSIPTTLTGLDSGRTYYVYVASFCSPDTSEFTSLVFSTLASSPSTLPYICDFEGTGNNGWELLNGTQTNKWAVGSATNNGGNQSLYISNDNGTSNSYTISSTSNVFAYRNLILDSVGDYYIQYDWKANGESCCDYIRVALVPATVDFAAGSTGGFGTGAVPSGAIALDGGDRLNVSSNWNTYTEVFPVSTPGSYRLVFFWHNDGSVGTNPPAAIDNVSFGRLSCSLPVNLTITRLTTDSVYLSWGANGAEGPWVVRYDTIEYLVTNTTDAIGGLVAGTLYTFGVATLCGSDTSLFTSIQATPGSWNMRANQTDTVRMCGGIIYDDGGSTGDYTNSQSSTIILMPDAPNNLISLSGTFNTESCCDHLYFYDGIGTSGTLLWSDASGSSGTFGPVESNNGPITIHFSSDASVVYSGFAINVSCISASCRITNLMLDPAVPQSDHQLSLTWDDNGALFYEVEYGNLGFAQGTGTTLTTTTNSILVSGLTALTSYDVYVRSICSGADTGSWAHGTFQTAMCDNITIAENWDSTSYATYTEYGPIGYSCYNYSYVQTIIDSAYLATLEGDITAFGFKPFSSASSYGNYFTGMNMYMANISESEFTTDFIHPDANHQFVHVISNRSLNFTTDDWQIIGLDSSFTWDGHSNLLVAFTRTHGTYRCSAEFEAHEASGYKMAYAYDDYDTFNINTASDADFDDYVGDIRLYSCGAAGCRQPVITGVTHTYEDATVTWAGSGNAYEVNIKESAAATWPATDIAVSGNSYNFTGLHAATYYTVRVRQDCTADSLGYSNWATYSFLTDSLPCLAPDSLRTTAVTNSTATFDWNPRGYETQWDIHVWFAGGLDSTYRVSTRPATVGGFTPGVTYNAAIRALCGTSLLEGEWGDTIQFSTSTCPDVTGLTTSGVTANSVTLNWTANPMAQGYVIEYGYAGFTTGSGITALSNTNSYVVNGLTEETTYDFHVRAMCGNNWYSETWTNASATTLSGGVPCVEPTNVATAVAGNSVTVSWTSGEGNVSFELEYGPHGFVHSAGTITTATTSPVVISNLDYETQYDVYVRALCDQNFYSSWSTVATFTTDAEPSQDCDPVQNLTVTEITDSTATVSWTPGTTGSNWNVVLTNASGNTLDEGNTEQQQYQFTGLTAGTDYMIKVRTDCGDDQYSAYVSVNFRTTGGVGISDISTATCAIYPNPTSSATTISVSGVNGKVRIAIVDMNGRTVASETMECSSNCVKTMDVERLAQGAYFVRITGESVNMVRKLIVR